MGAAPELALAEAAGFSRREGSAQCAPSPAEGRPARPARPWKREEISVTPPVPVSGPEEASRGVAYRRELYRIKLGIAPILQAQRPALAVCGRYGQRNFRDDTDPRNGVIDLVKRPREVANENGTKRVEWRAGIAHVATCKNPHVCPTCSNFLRIHRAKQVNTALAAHGIQRTLMLTMTTRHHAEDSPARLLLRWREACKATFSGKAWKAKKERLALIGQIRAMEVTHGGANGWHIHQHRVLLVRASLGDEEIAVLEAWLSERWCRAVDRTFGRRYVPSRTHGVRLTRTPPGEYLCKLGLELVDTGTKKPKTVDGEMRRTFFGVAADAASGDVEAMALVREYAAAVHGEKQIHWSQGLKALFGITDKTPKVETELVDLDDEPKAIGETDEEAWRSAAVEEGRVVATLPEEFVETTWQRGYGRRTPFGVPMVAAVLEALDAHEDERKAENAARVVIALVVGHGADAELASLEAANAQLAEWGRPIALREKRPHRTRNRKRTMPAAAPTERPMRAAAPDDLSLATTAIDALAASERAVAFRRNAGIERHEHFARLARRAAQHERERQATNGRSQRSDALGQPRAGSRAEDDRGGTGGPQPANRDDGELPRQEQRAPGADRLAHGDGLGEAGRGARKAPAQGGAGLHRGAPSDPQL